MDSVVYQPYINALSADGYKVVGTSKWFNAAVVKGNITGPLPYPFVRYTQELGRYKIEQESILTPDSRDTFDYNYTQVPISMLKLDEYHKRGYTGRGVTVAFFDAGWTGMDTFAAFDSVWANHQILAYHDFADRDTTVFEASGHGTAVMSLVVGNYPDSMVGAAPHVTLVLGKTEDAGREVHMEEYNWVKAMEWADSIGVDIIHSSLGYSKFDTLQGDYTYADMNGETTIITKAANLAVEKGIFVTNSAGNEGAKDWHYITAPCDGKGVLCVGAVDSFGKKAGFSSFGPSADGRVKPEVMAMGKNIYIIDGAGTLQKSNGTSLSGPLIAGLVACLKEAWPKRTNEEIFDAIIRSASQYDHPDSAYGYGIPNVLIADSLLGTIAGVSTITNDPVKIFPNPGNGEIRFEGNDVIRQIEICDLNGRILYQSTVHSKSGMCVAEDLKSGIYIVRMTGDGWVQNSRYVRR